MLCESRLRCWIEPATPKRLLALYGWVWVVYAFLLGGAIRLATHLNKRLRHMPGSRFAAMRKHVLSRLFLYPVRRPRVTCCCMVP